jgi:hypothetical protein
MDQKKTLDDLRLEEAELERRLAELRTQRVALEKGKRSASAKPMPPLRDQVLEILDDAGYPLNSLLLASVMRPLYGRTVPSTRFGTLSNDEVKSFESSRARPTYLCHCLTYDQGQPVKRFWARSDWALSMRIMAPMTGRLLFLRGAAWAIELARSAERRDREVSNLEILKFVAADQARDAGLHVKRGEFPYAEWLAEISIVISKIAEEDRVIREESAKVLADHLSDRDQLFGSAKGFVSLPGSRSSWRSGNE